MVKRLDVKPGDRYDTNNGPCKVVRYMPPKVEVEFIDTGYRTICYMQQLKKRGQVRDPYHRTVHGVGYRGEGPHSTRDGPRAKSRAYRVWVHMLDRCYGQGAASKCPTYHDVEVCEAWHCFQTFAAWYEAQPHNETFCLDKDVLGSSTGYKGKLYSPQHCALLPNEINAMFREEAGAHNRVAKGVKQHATTGRYEARTPTGRKTNRNSHYVGIYATSAAANRAYVEAKAVEIIRRTQEFHHVLSPRVVRKLRSIASALLK